MAASRWLALFQAERRSYGLALPVVFAIVREVMVMAVAEVASLIAVAAVVSALVVYGLSTLHHPSSDRYLRNSDP